MSLLSSYKLFRAFSFSLNPSDYRCLEAPSVNDPIAKSFEDPLILSFYLAFLVSYIILVIAQMVWIKNNKIV